MIKKKYKVTHGCTYCMTCLYECPVSAISMGTEGAVIDQARCIGCGVCYENCASEAISPIEVHVETESRVE